ncbi:MAG: tRNA 2-selenouridine(34) synthase MnmH [Verrucomicrobiales bacterium]|nr:tRNA 2-selenouridine(34) synthase MnmH [Verrucomicrobiales bacterium]
MAKLIQHIPVQRVSPNSFDEIIDARAPVEFAEDHITGAINLPVLWDDERKQIGTQYKQESAFEARRAGAALVSGNIGRHLKSHFAGKPESYRPLIYCFRGGQRSHSLATVLAEVGWEVTLLEGGYKAYRLHVISQIENFSSSIQFQVINGLTGSGKTAVLCELEKSGFPVLDLEAIACHKGSVFGEDPDFPQPSQKRFESILFDQLTQLADDKPKSVFVEAESSKIGKLHLPVSLWNAMRDSPVLEISAPLDSRVRHLQSEYSEWLTSPDYVIETIDRLQPFHSCETIAEWKKWAAESNWAELIGALLTGHYDKNYRPDGNGYFNEPDCQFELTDHSADSIRQCAEAIAGKTNQQG